MVKVNVTIHVNWPIAMPNETYKRMNSEHDVTNTNENKKNTPCFTYTDNSHTIYIYLLCNDKVI